jgi:DNA invertase Pin-like site-specific DNA recombinase
MIRTNCNGRPINAVGYLRCSTDKQETSIDDQRTAVQQHADAHGYAIVRWYVDDGISGDDTEKRLDFLRMMADAGDRADFNAILVWDQDRFGRFSPHEASFRTWPLAQAGIQLVTTDKGPIDWSDFTEWLTYSVNQQGKHQFLRDLSRNVTRGQLEAAKKGSWIGGIPYGFRLEGEKKNKRLVLGDTAKIKIVERIFHEFVELGRSMSNIATRLNDERVPSSGGRGKPWRFDAIKVILENPAYVGDYVGCRASNGKYNTIRGGNVATSTGRCRKPESEWIIFRDHHPAIIGRDTLAQAQAILARAKTGRSPHTPETNPYLFTGLLRCGRCGESLWGMDSRRRLYYECSNRKRNGNAACKGTTVREDHVLATIADHLEHWLGFEFDGEALGTAAYYGALTAADLPEAFAELRKLLMPRGKPKQDRKRLEKRAEKMTAEVEKMRKNLARLDAEFIPVAQDEIRSLDAELVALDIELRECKPATEQDINKVVEAVINNLYSLAYMCRSLAKPHDEDGWPIDKDGWVQVGSLEMAAPRAVRRFLNRVSHITCHTKQVGRGTGTRHVLDSGEIVLSRVGGVTGNLNPHRPG